MEENKELDDFIRKSIQEVGLDKPSLDFTNAVLSKINKEVEVSPVFEHEPLFSKTTWVVVISAVLGVFGYVIFGQSSQEATWLTVAQMNQLASYNIFGNMPELPFSNTILYGVVAVTLCIWVQAFVINKQQPKSYNFS